jgi:hypothetical protein
MSDPYQYDFFGGEPPAQRHSPTSVEAAQSITPQRIGELHRAIMGLLREQPEGATDEEMQDELFMLANTQRPRRRELQLAGIVEDSGKTRLTRTGRNAVVWRLTRKEEEEGAAPFGS